MSLENRLSKKLYEPRSIDGEPNIETFEVVNFFKKELQDLKGFVAVDPHGSTLKGYGDSNSDIDIRIRIDVGTEEIVDNIEAVKEISDVFESKLRELSKQFYLDTGMKVHTSVFFINEAGNLERLKDGLFLDETDPLIVGSVFRAVKGDKMNYYRESVVSYLSTLDEPTRCNLIEKMSEALVEEEWISFDKVIKRSDEEVNLFTLKETRKEMWSKRIRSFLDRHNLNG